MLKESSSFNTQVNREDLPIDEIKFPLGKPPLKINLHQQIYRSKPSENNSLELFVDNIAK